jgi:hypothetical protein
MDEQPSEKVCPTCGGPVKQVCQSKWKIGCGRFCSMKCRPFGHTKRHGQAGAKPSPTYYSWRSMRVRCNNPGGTGYGLYGGRGIRVCDAWNASFEAFLADMGERPDGMTLDRIDVNGDYCPENCRWATQSQQNRNTRIVPRVIYRGEKIAVPDLADKLGVSTSCLKYRIKTGWPEEAWAKPSIRA